MNYHPLKFLIIITLLLGMTSELFAKKNFRSGSYSHRAKIQWREGNYTAAHALYRNALSESIREANLPAEGFIKLNMATMELEAMRYDQTTKYIQSVPPNHGSLNLDYQGQLLQLNLGLALNDCQSAMDKVKKTMLQNSENEEISLKAARIPLSMCLAQQGQYDKAARQLHWADEEFEESAQGLRAWGRAYLSLNQRQWTQAIEHLHIAFDHAQAAIRPYDLGYILYYLGYSYEQLGKTALAAQFYKRSYQVYEKIQLARPTMRSLKKFIELAPQDHLKKSLSVLESQHSTEDLKMIYQAPQF